MTEFDTHFWVYCPFKTEMAPFVALRFCHKCSHQRLKHLNNNRSCYSEPCLLVCIYFSICP